MNAIRHLREEDADAFVELRREALREAPLAFASAPGDDVAGSADRVRQQLRQAPDAVIFGAFQDGLVGAVGLYRDRHVKCAHKAHLWGMYVTPRCRGRGIGAGLLEAALRHAAELPGVCWVHLSVSSAAPAARRLYEQAGFRLWGTEPDALRHEGDAVIEHHLALRVA